MSIRVLLADDHQILREGLKSLLSEEREIEVVAEADTGRSAVQLARQHRPDIVIMDITMPDLNGFEATQRILEELPAVKVIALSMHVDKQYVAKMFNAGAAGYLLKDCASKELAGAIRAVVAGGIYLSSEIGWARSKSGLDRRSLRDYLLSTLLSPKEREVLQLIAEGKTTKYIAMELIISEKTVEKHRTHLMEKLNLHSIAELTKYAIREGMTSLDK
jgi:DNA-binding NarL/FixJ family response regulator